METVNYNEVRKTLQKVLINVYNDNCANISNTWYKDSVSKMDKYIDWSLCVKMGAADFISELNWKYWENKEIEEHKVFLKLATLFKYIVSDVLCLHIANTPIEFEPDMLEEFSKHVLEESYVFSDGVISLLTRKSTHEYTNTDIIMMTTDLMRYRGTNMEELHFLIDVFFVLLNAVNQVYGLSIDKLASLMK